MSTKIKSFYGLQYVIFVLVLIQVSTCQQIVNPMELNHNDPKNHNNPVTYEFWEKFEKLAMKSINDEATQFGVALTALMVKRVQNFLFLKKGIAD